MRLKHQDYQNREKFSRISEITFSLSKLNPREKELFLIHEKNFTDSRNLVLTESTNIYMILYIYKFL